MDGTSFTIATNAENIGVSSSAEEVLALADSLNTAKAVSTSFDAAITRTEALLASASAAALQAADALAAGNQKYASLEAAANRAAKAAEKAAQAGKADLGKELAAAAAAQALQEQGVALDTLRSKASSTAAAEAQLVSALKAVKSAANEEAAAMSRAGPAAVSAGQRAQGLGKILKSVSGATGPYIGQVKDLAEGFGSAGLAGVLVAVVAGFVALAASGAIAVLTLAKLAIGFNKIEKAKIDKILEKAKENFGKLFAGVRVEKFTKGLADVTKLLDENTASGKALKSLIEGLLNPLFDAIPKLVPMVQQFFRGMILGALLVAIALLKVYIAVRNMIPPETKAAIASFIAGIDWLTTSLYAGAAVVIVMAIAIGVLTAVVLVLAAIIGVALLLAFVSTVAVFAVFAAGAALVGLAIFGIIGIVMNVIGWLSQLGARASATADELIYGLVNGIRNGTGMVIEAIRSLGSSAIKSLKSALGIASPSKYALEFAGNVTDTFAGKLDEGSRDVGESMRGLAEPPDMPRSSSGASSGGRGKLVDLTGATLNFYGVKDAEHARDMFEEMLTSSVEGDVHMLGGEVPA